MVQARWTPAAGRGLVVELGAGLLVVGVLACKGGSRAPAGTGTGSGTSGAAAVTTAPTATLDAAAGPPTATLDAAALPVAAPAGSLRGKVPLAFAVSSQVDNPRKSPADLIDGSLATAWNSRTGQLVGSWIAVRVPAEARVTALRMTVGATADATAAGDPFTMNHRISRVRLSRNGEVLAELELDPDLRTPQELPTGTAGGVAGGDFKLEVLATVPGSKKFWREICVSELDVLGTAPPTPGDHPSTIAIGALDAEPELDDALALAPMAVVGSMQAVCDKIGVAKGECAAMDYDPSFPSVHVPPPPSVPGWTKASFVGRDVSGHDCHLVVEAGGAVYAARLADTCSAPTGDQVASTVADVIPGGSPELVIRLRHELRPAPGAPRPVRKPPDLSYETYRVCGATAAGVPGCTEGLVVAGISEATEGDDPEPVARVVWSNAVTAHGGGVIVRAGRGEASYDFPEATEPGRYRLRP